MKEQILKKIGTAMLALFIAVIQVVVFYGLMPLYIAKTMYDWRCWRVVHVAKFLVRSAARTIDADFKEWYR